MTKSIRSKLASLLGIALVATSLAVAASTGTAAADDVSGFAQGLPGLSLGGGNPIGAAGCTGTGSPAGASNTCDVSPILPTAPLVDLGVAAQDVATDTNGHVAACGGLIGEGGAIEVGDDFECAIEDAPNGNQGLQVLDVLGGALVGLDAAYAECFSSATGNIGSSATIRNLTVLGTNVATLDSPPNTELDVLGLATVRLNTQTPIPNGIRVTALEVEVLGGVLNLEVGTVECRVDAINNDRTSGVFDTAGDVVDEPGATLTAGQTVQPNSRNALAVTFASGGDRNDGTGVIRLGPGVAIDTGRGSVGGQFQTALPNAGLPTGCVSTQNVAEPLDPRIVCELGDMTGGIPVTRTIPVTLGDVPANGRFEASAQLFATTSNPASLIATGQGPVENGGRGPVFGGAPLTQAEATNLSGPRYGLIQVAAEVQENIFQVEEGTTLVIPELDADLDLPENVGGKLYLDLPNFVESVRYGTQNGAPFNCDIVDENPVPVDEVVASAYPFLPDAGNQKWDCGQAIKPVGQERQIELDVAAGTPENLAGALGRAVVIRRTTPPTFAPPAVQENSFYSDLLIQVTEGPIDPPDEDAPSVDIQKTVNNIAAPGGDFTYTLVVTNLDNEPAEIEALTDTITSGPDNGDVIDLNGVGTCDTGAVLASSNAGVTDTYTCTFTRNFTGDTGDSESDQAYVRVRDTDGDELTAEDTDVAIATIGNEHRLAVTKSAVDDDLAEPGGVFTYNVTITNDDDLFDGDVTITSVIDEISNAADRDLTATAQAAGCTVLSEGESCAFQFTNTFTGEAGDTQDDEIVVTGTAADGPASGRSLPVRVDIVDGGDVDLTGLDVDLTADPTSIPEPGGTT
ncbi:MAG: hypothetical protein M3Z03_17745, partial [Actinomycetota bacterium]|nr:hypothetical protein [Actinomycetota bacterium]